MEKTKIHIFLIKSFFLLVVLSFLIFGCQSGDSFESNLPSDMNRVWIGPEFWANPLQDWQLHDGRIECSVSGGDRNIFLLTHELVSDPGSFEMSVLTGRIDITNETLDPGWIGFKVGVRGIFDDYRDSAVRGVGLPLGLTTRGQLFIGKLDESAKVLEIPLNNIRLKLVSSPGDVGNQLTLSVLDQGGAELASLVRDGINADLLNGGVALVCSHDEVSGWKDKDPERFSPLWGGKPETTRGGNVRFWFRDWKISGSKVKEFRDRVLGPIVFSQYTLANSILKITAQLTPVSMLDGEKVKFEIRKTGKWETIAESSINELARTATFEIKNWDGSHDVPFRLGYDFVHSANNYETHHWEGTIRKEPWNKNEFILAGFTGNNDLGFPNNELVRAVKYHNPDFLFFSGDQIYEGVAGYGVQRLPLDKAALDYLRKWYLYGWAYGDLMRDRPTVAIPDDHDVYHGNIWGAGGVAAPAISGQDAQDAGGYKMPAEWVNMVQRTQTSHLPQPYDPKPVAQDISVYYCNINYAGISFAVLEDRKFKSAPKPLLLKAKVRNGWAQNRHFNAEKEGDVKGAVLLGERQLQFLEQWASDWSTNTWMKVVLSQTIFANVATLPKAEAYSDVVVPKLRIMEPGDYPPDDIPVSDMDSNGWPQSGRNKALREMRKGFAFHIAGDQHLGSMIQYGIDEYGDAGYAFCVPAISNVWPRRWFPVQSGKNQLPDAPKYTGDFKDGFGNKITVHAVSNPYYTGKKPSKLYDRATGYGIVRFNKQTRDITIECWPRWVDPSAANAEQYPGWPVKLNQQENYNQKAVSWLPEIRIQGLQQAVFQVIDENSGDVVYTLRLTADSFRPKVFKRGKYILKIGDPDNNKWEIVEGVDSGSQDDNRVIEVKF